jgi:hypothetical protein
MAQAQRLAHAFDTHLSIVKEICGVSAEPDGHEFSLAVEHLELASFYAKKTLAQKFQNQDHGAEVEQPGMEVTGESITKDPRPTPQPLDLYTTGSLELEIQRRHRSQRDRGK